MKGYLSKQIQNHFTACCIRTLKPGTGPGTDNRAWSRSDFTFEDPAISAGIGISGLDGLIRLDVARSLQGREPNAWRVYLSVDGLI